jgi:transglutaminase-like putative cysteine protease
MSSDGSLTDEPAGREYSRVFLAVVCLVAVVFASAVLPTLAVAGGVGGSGGSGSPFPIPSQAGSAGATGSAPGDGGLSGDAASGLGALNPPDSTAVGGDRTGDANGAGGDNPFQSQDAEIHFTASSSERVYWRTGSYDSYTGTGWSADSESSPYDGGIQSTAATGETVSYAVTLEQRAAALPTVWRPATVSRESVLVTEDRSIRSARPLPAGTQYTGTSVRPTEDPAVLRASGRDYPDSVASAYTSLPSETDERLGPFVADLTADDDNPYETARTIEQWLETEKAYSLNVSREPGDDIASEFVFEMDRGYCEYFATSMAAMLRSQDIPARYVVGYAPGQRTGEEEYTVRAMDAHAWVEVYFEDVGWVRFDPTPASERQQQEREALAERGIETTPTDGGEGTPPSDATPSGETETEQPTATERQAGSYTVSLNRTATPGAVVTVTVTRDDSPVEGAGVSFNGASVGRTDGDGTVVGTVPYTRRLDITVDPPPAQASVGHPADGRLFAVADPLPQQSSNTSFELETEATLNVSITPDGRLAVVATVEDVPLRAGAVAIDGERVGTTDDTGWAAVPIPAALDNATVTVRRGSVGGEATLTGLRTEVSPQAPLALPGTDATVNATLNGEPARNATVLVNGERVTTTGADGTATIALPLTSTATVTVVQHGQRSAATVDGLLLNLAIVVAVALGVLGGVVYGARRRGITLAVLAGWLRHLGQLAVGALVAVATTVDTLLVALWTRIRLTAAHIRALVIGRASPAALLTALRAWLRDRLAAARDAADSAVGGTEPSGQPDGADTDESRLTIRSAWRRFLACLSVGRHRTRTPGELATHAVEEDGIPPGAVATLRDEFRAVEYGQRDPSDRVAAVQRAIERIEAAVEEPDEPDERTEADR